jgi:hypothetical protein
MGIRAYHGSPHDFDTFDLSKIGTGEGAQAYGHGLYFAENPNVAASYRNLAPPPPPGSVTPEVAAAVRSIDNLGFDRPSQALTAIRSNPDWLQRFDVDPRRSAAEANAVKTITGYLDANPRGRMYEVDINADPDQFLDWDKPFSQQSAAVQAGLRKIGYTPPDPQSMGKNGDLGATIVQSWPGHATDFSEAGIPGIKYLDQGSRASGSGSSNYVVFDPKNIAILKKYGISGLSAGATAASEADSNDTDSSQ